MTTGPTVYLLHFSRPLGNLDNPRALASHYVGWAANLDRRIRQHRAGEGCHLTRAAVERGIAFEVVATWPGDWRLERHIKSLKAAPRLCPHCGQRHRRGPLCISPTHYQLELALDEWPELPASHWTRPADWYELSYLRRRRPAAPVTSPLYAEPVNAWDIPF